MTIQATNPAADSSRPARHRIVNGSLGRASRLSGMVALGLALVAGCVDRIPSGLRENTIRGPRASLAVAPSFPRRPEGSAPIVLSSVVGTLRGPNGETFTATATFHGDTAVLEFEVPLQGITATFQLDLVAFDNNGVVAYTAHLDRVEVRAGGDNTPAAPQFVYAAPDAGVRTIRVSPNPLALNAGATGQLGIAGTDANNQPVPNVRAGWVSRDGSVASVDANGLVRAGQFQGATWIVAQTLNGIMDSVRVTVTAPVNSVTVAPTSVTLARGQTQTFTATLRDVGNNVLTGRTVTWATSDASKASVNSSGVVTAVANGTNITITATSEGKSATATVNVVSPVERIDVTPTTKAFTGLDQTQQFTATVVPRTGASVSGISVAWSIDKPSVATIDGNGLVTAKGNGTATVTATADGISQTASVSVQQVATTLTLSPKSVVFNSISGTQLFTADVTDANGKPIANAPVTWTVGNADVGVISSFGEFKPTGFGVTTVTATSGAASAQATVSIRQVAVRVQVTTPDSSIMVDETVQATGRILDEAGQVVTGSVTWSVSDPAKASVSASGLVTALAAGTVDIIGSGRGLTGRVTLTIAARPNTSLLLNVSEVEKLPRGTQQFSVTAGGTGPYIWSVNGVDGGNATFGTITTAGFYTAPAAVPTPDNFNVCARQASPAASGCAHVTIKPIPSGGADVIVFNDVNMFDSFAGGNPNNQQFYKNLVQFTGAGARATKTFVMMYSGHSGGYSDLTGFRSGVGAAGMTIEDVSVNLTSAIDPKFKVIFMVTPYSNFSVTELNNLKSFAAEGGRIIFVGEHSGYYGAGIPVENAFLSAMGAQLTNTGGAWDCGYNTLPLSSLRPHQIMNGLTNLTMGCASEVALGPNDYALFYTLDNVHVIGAVAKIDVTPISISQANEINNRFVRSLATPFVRTQDAIGRPIKRDYQ